VNTFADTTEDTESTSRWFSHLVPRLTVNVVAGPPLIDPTSTTAGAVISSDLLERVPVGRRISDTLYLAPGVSSGGTVGQANPSVSGGSGLENQYVIDGVNVTNQGYGALGSYSIIFGSLGNATPFDVIKDVEVKTAGYQAEFGQSTAFDTAQGHPERSRGMKACATRGRRPISSQARTRTQVGENIKKIREKKGGDIVVLHVDGDLTMDEGGATRLADKVRSRLQQGRHRILLDLGRVRYVDSAGLGELVQCSAAVRTRGGSFKLLNVNRRLRDLLIVTKLVAVLESFDRDADTIASVNTAGSTSVTSRGRTRAAYR
jgi:anti-anti-sigma factor